MVALAWSAALVSFNPADPSWNTASAVEPANWLGRPGAALADLMMQTLGLAGVLLAPLAAAWGYRLTADHRLPLPWLRLGLVPVLLLLAALALALTPRLDSWSLLAGMGGFLGDLMARPVLDHLPAVSAWLAPVLGAVAVVFLIAMMGFTPSEWWRAARGSWGAARGGVRLARRAGELPAQAGDLVARLRGEERVEPVLVPREKVPPAPPREPPEKRPVKADRVAPRGDAAAERRRRIEQMAMDLGTEGGFRLPPVDLLDEIPEAERKSHAQHTEALEQNARLLESVLEDFGVRGEIMTVRPGPVVTLYELQPAPGTKASRRSINAVGTDFDRRDAVRDTHR
jgi:S-DNA-T family DNA segregation ATPase FtsK/SpoIIIE